VYDNREAFTFNDISLVPNYSDTEREDINITTKFCGYDMTVPVLSSPMDTVTNMDVVQKMRECGGLGIHHRYYAKGDEDYNEMLYSARLSGGIAVSPSMPVVALKKFIGVNPEQVAVIDVAHGHTQRNLDFAKLLQDLGYKHIVSGNIATLHAALSYIDVGVKILRVGIGAGFACTTRTNIGVGIPQAYAVSSIWRELPTYPMGTDITIISDGGHRTTGDIIKALVLGADYVMLGSMLAGCNESPSGTTYRGMASKEAQSARGKQNFVVEGITKTVERKGALQDVLNNIRASIEQACYYVGARNLDELKGSDWVFVSNHGYQEGLA
jgi:IMP dehydrogenase